jgi:hypothetical protein
MQNTEILAANTANLAVLAKLGRAANTRNGRHVIVSEDEAKAIYNLPEFNGDADCIKGWIMHTTKKMGRVQIAMSQRQDGKFVCWGM